jgi:hypothetical protein
VTVGVQPAVEDEDAADGWPVGFPFQPIAAAYGASTVAEKVRAAK